MKKHKAAGLGRKDIVKQLREVGGAIDPLNKRAADLIEYLTMDIEYRIMIERALRNTISELNRQLSEAKLKQDES